MRAARSRDLLAAVDPKDPPGTRWEYNTADSQVLDWVRERATGTHLRRRADRAVATCSGCVHDAVVGVDAAGVALAGGGLAACAEDWLRLAALQLTGTAYDARVLGPDWVQRSSTPAAPVDCDPAGCPARSPRTPGSATTGGR